MQAFHKAVMNAYWQEARGISAISVYLKEIASKVGLNTLNNSRQHYKEPQFDAEVSADIQLAHEYGLTWRARTHLRGQVPRIGGTAV